MRARLNHVIMIFVGVVLLAAAGLKLYGLSVSPLPSVGWLSVPGVQLAVVMAEVIVGAWLLSGVEKPFAWLAGLVTFGGFAVVSCYLGVIGQASCGCFGTIPASPWAAFAVDLGALAALWIARPRGDCRRALPVRPAATILAGGLLVFGLLALGGAVTYGSVPAALAALRGESLGLPGYVDFGAGGPGESRTQSVAITNWTDRPIRIIAGTADCSCVTTADLPVTIPPRATHPLSVTLKLSRSGGGQFTRKATLWTDADDQRVVTFHLGARIE